MQSVLLGRGKIYQIDLKKAIQNDNGCTKIEWVRKFEAPKVKGVKIKNARLFVKGMLPICVRVHQGLRPMHDKFQKHTFISSRMPCLETNIDVVSSEEN